jgi:manganese transport protein
MEAFSQMNSERSLFQTEAVNDSHSRLKLLKKTHVLYKIKTLSKFLGPAFIVSVAYIDPGNFATNINGGSVFNYDLLWVILWSNLMAIFLQIMSAKLGIAADANLTQVCKKVFSKKVNWFFWIVAESAAAATTLAEFLGGALGIYLLFNISLPSAGVITGIITFAITSLQKYGQKLIELIIFILTAVVSVSYMLEMFLAKPDWVSVGIHTMIPSFSGDQAVLIAAGMLGATVMPHVIYLHSQLVQCRNFNCTLDEKKKHLKLEKLDIFIAMNIAFIVNSAMVIVSAAVFHRSGVIIESIEQAERSLEPLLGRLSSDAFALALLASGFSSSTVGAMAGETVMDGFVDIKLPVNLKRLITMAPGMIIIAAGINPMKALLMSQVGLSFALPAAIIPMLIITNKKSIMGDFVNKKWVSAMGWIISGIIILMNSILLLLAFS